MNSKLTKAVPGLTMAAIGYGLFHLDGEKHIHFEPGTNQLAVDQNYSARFSSNGSITPGLSINLTG